MNTTVSKATWFLLSIAGIAVLIFVAAARPGRDRPVTVGLVHASRQDLSSWTTGNGKIEPIDARIIQSQLTTRIESVNITEGRTGRPKARVSFEVGDTVRVVEGPFANSQATVQEVKSDKQKLKVSLSMFGRATSVELDFSQVEKA